MYTLLIIIAGKLIALLVGLFFIKTLPKPYKLILCQVAVALASECYGKYLIREHHAFYNNVWVFNWYLLFDLWLTGIAGQMLVKNGFIKKLIPYLLSLLTVLWIINIYIKGMSSFANWCFTASSIVLILIYIVVLFDRSLFTSQNIFLQPALWLSLSVILFYGCDLPYFGILNYFLGNKVNGLVTKLALINYFLNFIRYPLIAVSFILCSYYHQKSNLKLSENVFK